jgi:hypothetical protein
MNIRLFYSNYRLSILTSLITIIFPSLIILGVELTPKNSILYDIFDFLWMIFIFIPFSFLAQIFVTPLGEPTSAGVDIISIVIYVILLWAIIYFIMKKLVMPIVARIHKQK